MNTTNLKKRMNGKIQELQIEPNDGKEDATMQDTGLAIVNSDYAALANNAADIIRDNLKNQPLSHSLFDMIKSPSGGTTAFTIPGLSGDEINKKIEGIILSYSLPRAYWETPDPVEGTPPSCCSRDSLTAYSDGKPCRQCAYNSFGSKNGETNAKACKEFVEIFLLKPDSIMPVIVRVPVSSKMLFLKYATRLVGCMKPIYSVVTKITLEKTTNRTGQPYAVYKFEAVDTLSPEEAAKAKAFGQMFMEILDAAYDEPQEVKSVS